MKYWNKARIRRVRERRERREERALVEYVEVEVQKRTHTKGDARKNARLMLEALANPVHRRMLTRLAKSGAMSVTHLARPFHIYLSETVRYVEHLERAGLIITEKRGRIRFCVYNRSAVLELAEWLTLREPFDID